ncbi:MAG TPA: hypothetical protein PLD20_14220 [Blastocatellia bacterium]|nr:hypothetical protein [Blastocatellia bacterium]HMV84161.1 hypothetical protein [Blastocatellia bacterium]HMX25396.1 hypothetical protein [Blastocatellia bacterium]HMY71784.1 hypothetical protein [Blastocatellia bacterium]HMZ19088.1 hypothetical protein [Blastocatellia bacterium]
MAVEWLLLWGAGKAAGALAKPVLEDLAKDIAKDPGKSLLAGAKKRAAKLILHNDFLKLYGKALKELIEVIEEELRNAGVTADKIDAWAEDLKQFVRNESIREALPDAFADSAGSVEAYELKRGWPVGVPLPPDFDWDYVAKIFNRKLKSCAKRARTFAPCCRRNPLSKLPPAPNRRWACSRIFSRAITAKLCWNVTPICISIRWTPAARITTA